MYTGCSITKYTCLVNYKFEFQWQMPMTQVTYYSLAKTTLNCSESIFFLPAGRRTCITVYHDRDFIYVLAL